MMCNRKGKKISKLQDEWQEKLISLSLTVDLGPTKLLCEQSNTPMEPLGCKWHEKHSNKIDIGRISRRDWQFMIILPIWPKSDRVNQGLVDICDLINEIIGFGFVTFLLFNLTTRLEVDPTWLIAYILNTLRFNQMVRVILVLKEVGMHDNSLGDSTVGKLYELTLFDKGQSRK